MRLVIVHHHWRPGGVRRVIELATPHLVRQFRGMIRDVVLAAGERADPGWATLFEDRLSGTQVKWFIEPAFGYLAERGPSAVPVRERLRAGLDNLLGKTKANDTLVWMHNPGVARNLVLTRELTRACAARGLPLVFHHHDWWFDNRWLRWAEIRRDGFHTLTAAAKAVFPQSRQVRHFAINRSDTRTLRRNLAGRAAWLPNPASCTPRPSERRVRAARTWLRRELNLGDAPVWVFPCRLLRRKNVAEALLLTRWLRPDAWLVTTGGVSSADEQSYFNRLTGAARRHQWRLRLGILHGDETRKPCVEDLLGASEAVVLTSIQEGFGLPYLEATQAGRPVIARSLPNVAPDLKRMGFHFPQGYDEVWIAAGLFDWSGEQQRQAELYSRWRGQLPRACRRWAGEPALLAAGEKPVPVPFSRITLTAQLEVLAHAPERSWLACAPFNPPLSEWKRRSAAGRLQLTQWPRRAWAWLGGQEYARRFMNHVGSPARGAPDAGAAVATQNDFIRARLATASLFPILWARNT